MSELTKADFSSATEDFQRFAVQQGYPSAVLWTSPERIVIWRHRYFVLVDDPEMQQREAKSSFDRAIARNLGVSIEGKCKTVTSAICNVSSPTDDLDAQCRMFPTSGVKLSVAQNPLPAVLVKNRFLWWFLSQVGRQVPSEW